MFISYRVIDRLTPQVDFPVELKNGNIAVANSSPPSSCQSPSSWPGAQLSRGLPLLVLGAPITAAAQRAFGPGDRDARQFDESFRKYARRLFGVGYDWRVFKAQAMAESQLWNRPRGRSGSPQFHVCQLQRGAENHPARAGVGFA